MEMEVFIHIGRLDDFKAGKPVNVKVGFASQYDVKIVINLKKYVVYVPNGQNGLIVIRRKNLIDWLGLRKIFKYKVQ